METKFKVYYDDQLMDVVDNISAKLKSFGLTIEVVGGEDDDCWIEYEIVKIN